MTTLICPLCRTPLARDNRTWRCNQGHAFDVAREGYVNLLPVQQKHSLAPGDNVAMVRARRDFLAAGHYAPLRESMVAMLRPLAPNALLDIGCGEGYYTRAVASVASNVIGIDISKPAVQAAAKRAHADAVENTQWLVASSAALPLADASVDIVTSFFAPLPVTEMARVLKPGGHLLLATPAPAHLLSLRSALFDEIRPHVPEKFVAELAPAFALVAREDVAFGLTLDNAALKELLMMTPYVWRAKQEKRAALEGMTSVSTTAGFTLMLLRKPAAMPQPG